MDGVKLAGRAAVVAFLLAATAGVVWMFLGPGAKNALVSNANVIGGLSGVCTLAFSIMTLWPDVARRRTADAFTTQAMQVAVDYLSSETLHYWCAEAKGRKITMPSPAVVRWRWSSSSYAATVHEIEPTLLTEGVVNKLRELLYEPLGAQARIVLVGGPGSGKTTAMMLLLIDILKSRSSSPTSPVPLWLTLGSWNPDTTALHEWAAATLSRDHPGLVTACGHRSAAKELIRAGKVALFLDGLDEMPPERQGRALDVIDRESVGLPLVITSRPEQYGDAVAEGRLWGAAVIEMLPIDPDQARDFLLTEQLGDRRSAWEAVAANLKDRPDDPIARTLTTPLALCLARDAYANADPMTLLGSDVHPTSEALLQHLLFRSLTIAYPDQGEREHAVYWLSWIARHLGPERDLRWWEIHTWVSFKKQQLIMSLQVGVWLGILVGLAAGISVGRATDRVSGLVVGIVLGTIVGVLRGLVSALRLPEVVPPTTPVGDPAAIHRAEQLRGLKVGLAPGVVGGAGSGLVVGLPFGFASGLTVGLILGFAYWLTSGLSNDAASRLQIAELALGRGVKLMPFLESAWHKQVLRRAGTVYQFRHAALQDLLADPSRDAPHPRRPRNAAPAGATPSARA
ncbi:hypothetical protein Ais01nite_67600 [Asanoa ishikariensis]|uniref:NACHT domain-containing protein n=1 Tax=Asanoa ishikariensis TaxID=137265 RepID=A0A1H3NC68_9ACTN|nr:NACHT domain-containing protein [Asanoa ishikariensis]GIF68725.1 hypothetical protein Ais01nite_67600 [Asanoa ishikariensis]SDY86270.1 NACHT domain-containing protein [Asanoa ishikariensis]